MSDKQKAIRTTLYLPPELWKLTKIKAIKGGTTATEVVVGAISKELQSIGWQSGNGSSSPALLSTFTGGITGSRSANLNRSSSAATPAFGQSDRCWPHRRIRS